MPFTQKEARDLFQKWIDDPNVSQGLRLSLASILKSLDQEDPETARLRQKFLSAARDLYQNDELEFDDDAALSESQGGYWVQGWKWIANSEAKVEAMLLDPDFHCCQLLYGEDGFVAKCSQEKGVEHDHGSMSAEEAMLLGKAERVYDIDDCA